MYKEMRTTSNEYESKLKRQNVIKADIKGNKRCKWVLLYCKAQSPQQSFLRKTSKRVPSMNLFNSMQLGNF